MDGIQQVGADVKKQQGAASPIVQASSNKQGSAANAFSALMETIGARFNGNFGLPAFESKLIRGDDSNQVRVREPEEVDKPREKDEPRAAEKSDSKSRENDDEDVADETTQAGEEKPKMRTLRARMMAKLMRHRPMQK